MWQPNIALLLFYIVTTRSFKIHNLEVTSDNDIKVKKGPFRIFLPPKETDNDSAARILRRIKAADEIYHRYDDDSTSDSFEVMSSESENSNSVQVKMKGRPLYRRMYDGTQKDYANRHIQDELPSAMTSTEEDTRLWKAEWKKKWHDLQQEALILPRIHPIQGDVVKIAEARPWSKRCGDPMQHDVPYGVCTVSPECDPEFRIYRGDFYCGRTHFVCCGVDVTGHDTNQPIDVSFGESSCDSSTSNEKLKLQRGSKENKRRKRERHKKEQFKQKIKKRRQIKRKIKKILRDLYRQINRAYRNATDKKNRVANNLKSLVYTLKKKIVTDRDQARDKFHKHAILITKDLDDKLSKIKELNYNFLTNDTFKNILTQKSVSLVGARMLVEAYPELIAYPELSNAVNLSVSMPSFRRSGGLDQGNHYSENESKKNTFVPENYLDYDVEYGILNV